MKREALTEKVVVVGVDGLDPKFAKRCIEKGKMPNLEKFIEKGACREDLVLLGSMPTVTPPMWTTLATGANASTHGITHFFAQNPDEIDSVLYALDSRKCKAEQLWNVFAEAGKKTMVWHWPGSSWPPTSDNPNLAVVDGTQPASVNGGIATIGMAEFLEAREEIENLTYEANQEKLAAGVGCIIDDVEDMLQKDKDKEDDFRKSVINADGSKGIRNIVLTEKDTEVEVLINLPFEKILSPLKPAKGWFHAPENAKEFYLMFSKGLERRPALLLQNAEGIYDTVCLYYSKKDAEPYATIIGESIVYNVLEKTRNDNGDEVECVRHYQVTEIAADGSAVKMYINAPMDISRDDLFHPKSLYQDIITNVGHVPARPVVSGKNPDVVEYTMLPIWNNYCQWQADALTYFMKENKFDVIFSHLHNVDGMGHMFWHYGKNQEYWENDEAQYQDLMEQVYVQTDNYIGRFLPYIEEGWTVIITSDHGLVVTEHHENVLSEVSSVNVPVMRELGYTVMKKDADGNDTKELDYSKTKAVASRSQYIYLNLKGRYPYGIVDPADQYELEDQIISDLYNYRDKKTGKRVVSMALRNKDALVLGMGGPECGDIIFFMEEGYNIIHADSLSTQNGYADTSVSPIFVAAGPGIKAGFKTNRVIKQIDVAPTIAVLGGVRMPHECEGAPAYQILSEEF